ncbi:MAG: BON domain-containing protein [Cyanobacteria bacterium P01_C01_bin.89]
MADSSSQFSDQSLNHGSSGDSPPEDMNLLSNLVDLLAENLDQVEDSQALSDALDVPAEGYLRSSQKSSQPLKSAAPIDVPKLPGKSSPKLPPAPPKTALAPPAPPNAPPGTLPNALQRAPQDTPPKISEVGSHTVPPAPPSQSKTEKPEIKWLEEQPQLSVVVSNQAKGALTPKPKLPKPPPPSYQRSRSLIARSATDHSKVSNTTERLLHLQLRVLNTLLKLQQVTGDRPEALAPAAPPPQSPPKVPPLVDGIWSKFKLAIIVLVIALGALGIHHWVTGGDRQVQQRLSSALDTDPELSVYRVRSRVENGEVILSGRVPTAALQTSAFTVAQQFAPNYAIRNEVTVVQLPPNDQAIQQQVDQLLAIANEGAALRSRATVDNQSITLEGTVESDVIADRLVAQLRQIPGVVGVQDQLKRQPRAIATRIYFYVKSAEVLPADLTYKLRPIADQLKAHPQWQLEIIGHQHPNEGTSPESPLASQRAIAVRSYLEDLGVDRRRLEVIASPSPPPGTSLNEPAWTHQVVLFNLSPGDS